MIEDLATLIRGLPFVASATPRREPADVRTLHAAVNMPLVSVFTVRTVWLDASQAHGAAGAIRAFPMIKIRRHSDAFLLIRRRGALPKLSSSGLLQGSDEFVTMPSVATNVKACRSWPPIEAWMEIREPRHICRVFVREVAGPQHARPSCLLAATLSFWLRVTIDGRRAAFFVVAQTSKHFS